jgi:hypothetical protein
MDADVINMSFRVQEPTFGITCLARSTAAEPAVVTFNREAGGALTTAEMGGTIRSGAECVGEAATVTSDRGPVTVLNSGIKITVTLI